MSEGRSPGDLRSPGWRARFSQQVKYYDNIAIILCNIDYLCGMRSKDKEIIHYTCAVSMLIFGCSVSLLGFCAAPYGEVSDSVLWILGQSLIYSGSVFGVSLYVKSEIKKTLENGSK